MTQHKLPRQCPRCLKLIERADLVVFDAGELFHQRCFLQSGGVYDLVVEFLRRNRPSSFCHSCLSAMLRITYEDARKVVTGLRMEAEFSVLLGAPCAGCRQLRVVVQAVER